MSAQVIIYDKCTLAPLILIASGVDSVPRLDFRCKGTDKKNPNPEKIRVGNDIGKSGKASGTNSRPFQGTLSA